FEIVGRNRLVVIGAVVGGRTVVAPTDAFRQLVVQAIRHVTGTRKHHVFEEVRKAGAAGSLVLRAHVIPDVDRDRWRRLINRKDHGETVWKLVRLVRNFDLAERYLRQSARQRDGEQKR